MQDHLDAHPLYQRLTEEEVEEDPAAKFLPSASEEAQKVARNAGQTYRAVYRRL